MWDNLPLAAIEHLMWDYPPLGAVEHKGGMRCGTHLPLGAMEHKGGCDVTSCDKVRL
jgi:hypothetical protein